MRSCVYGCHGSLREGYDRPAFGNRGKAQGGLLRLDLCMSTAPSDVGGRHSHRQLLSFYILAPPRLFRTDGGIHVAHQHPGWCRFHLGGGRSRSRRARQLVVVIKCSALGARPLALTVHNAASCTRLQGCCHPEPVLLLPALLPGYHESRTSRLRRTATCVPTPLRRAMKQTESASSAHEPASGLT